MSCFCPKVPPTLTENEPHFEDLKRTLEKNGRHDDDIRMKCRICGKQWVYGRFPFMHADVNYLAEAGLDHHAYWARKMRENPENAHAPRPAEAQPPADSATRPGRKAPTSFVAFIVWLIVITVVLRWLYKH